MPVPNAVLSLEQVGAVRFVLLKAKRHARLGSGFVGGQCAVGSGMNLYIDGLDHGDQFERLGVGRCEPDFLHCLLLV